MEKEIITEDIKKVLRDAFKELRDEVIVEVFTKDGVNDSFSDIAIGLVKALSELTDKIKPHFYKIGDEMAKNRKVLRSPTVLSAPDTYAIRYTGAPVGEEGHSFITTLLMVSTGKTLISDDSRQRLKKLKEMWEVSVFVGPTCSYSRRPVVYGVAG